MNLLELKRLIKPLTPRQLRKLDSWLHGLMETGQKDAGKSKGRRGEADRRGTARQSYRLEGVRCGKENCKCAGGEVHGPYWYAYWSEGGRTRSKYIGKRLPSKKRR